MRYQKFDEVPAWQSAARLYNRVLDLLESHAPLFSSGFRSQIDRAALSVSNNIAEGFERTTTNELTNFLGIARGSAGEVRSMTAVVRERKTVRVVRADLVEIGEMADECVRQIMGWTKYLERSEVQGKRHLTPARKAQKTAAESTAKFRRDFLLSLPPTHPLYSTPEAKSARCE